MKHHSEIVALLEAVHPLREPLINADALPAALMAFYNAVAPKKVANVPMNPVMTHTA